MHGVAVKYWMELFRTHLSKIQPDRHAYYWHGTFGGYMDVDDVQSVCQFLQLVCRVEWTVVQTILLLRVEIWRGGGVTVWCTAQQSKQRRMASELILLPRFSTTCSSRTEYPAFFFSITAHVDATLFTPTRTIIYILWEPQTSEFIISDHRDLELMARWTKARNDAASSSLFLSRVVPLKNPISVTLWPPSS